MNTSAPGMITASLLARSAETALLLLVVAAIACPVVWSRDAGRRARARDVLRLLISLLTDRRLP